MKIRATTLFTVLLCLLGGIALSACAGGAKSGASAPAATDDDDDQTSDDDDNDDNDDDDDDDDNDDDDNDNDDDDNDDDDNDDDAVDPGFAFIPHGQFTMGSPPTEPGRNSDETQHAVTLTRDFEVAIRKTSQQEWTAAFGWNPSTYAACGDACPVDTVSWFDALAYADQASVAAGQTPCFLWADVVCNDGSPVASYLDCMNATQHGIRSATVTLNGVSSPYDCTGFRLATEAEWEYAIRAGTTTAYYDGIIELPDECSPADPNLDRIGWFCANTHGAPMPLGLKLANPWGLYDMSGDVFEWVWDWYAAYDGAATDPEGPSTPTGDRVMRGGGWSSAPLYCRSADRDENPPGSGAGIIGFRLARTLP